MAAPTSDGLPQTPMVWCPIVRKFNVAGRFADATIIFARKECYGWNTLPNISFLSDFVKKKSYSFKNASCTVFRKKILLRPPCTWIFKTFILMNTDIIENRNWMSVSMFWWNTIYILSIICEVYPVRLSQWLILNFGESKTIEIDELTLHQIQNSNPITDSNGHDKVINWTNIF